VSKDPTAPQLDAASWLEVVGIVADARYMNVREAPLPAMFQAASAPASGRFLVRTAGDPLALVGQLRAAVDASGSALRLTDVRTQVDQAATTYGRERHFARVSLLFGAVALLLTAIGVYGVLAYSVARQTHDIGVRLALGATPGHVMRRAIRETLLLAGGGIALGLAMVSTTTRLLGDMLYGVTPQSAGVIAIAVATMIAVALVAAIGPVRRASRIDPLRALRE
jgi:ABC-type antimicrobial peptide transport system permease subunit